MLTINDVFFSLLMYFRVGLAVVKTTCVSYLDFFKTAVLIIETDKAVEMRNGEGSFRLFCLLVSIDVLILFFNSSCLVRL